MGSQEKKGVGFIPAGEIHYIDHLGVICIIMDIPLLFLEDEGFTLAKRYYPGLDAQRIEYLDFNPEYLIKNYGAIFNSDPWDKERFDQTFAPLEEKYRKKICSIFCPHGFSDKLHYWQQVANEEIRLIYGQNHLDIYEYLGMSDMLKQYVITGNYRYTYFKKNQAFYDKVVKEEVLAKFERKQATVLYAPTWMDIMESTTFFSATSSILDSAPDNYNLIVKLHPHLELDDPANYYRIIGKYENKPNITFIRDFPLIYPLLAHTDIYIGDVSSIGYDFLTFNRPMFFLNKDNKSPEDERELYLFRCGISVTSDQYTDIFQIIEKNLPDDQDNFSEIRSEVYAYTFGAERSFEEIKADIIQAYQRI